MPGKLDQVVDNLLDGMHQISKIETVVGEPLQAGDAMLVPIHRLRVGFGVAAVGAGGHGESSEGNYGGRGVGGGVQVEGSTSHAKRAVAGFNRLHVHRLDDHSSSPSNKVFARWQSDDTAW